MTELRARSADERRAEIQAHAAALGIDDAYISLLVETFYGRIRGHALLGPIFVNAIGDDWRHHLEKMKSFWASVALSAGRYSGKPVPAHRKHTSIQPWHFNIWLGLFEQTLKDTAPTPEAVPFFMERARRIAQSLQLAMFGVPGLGAPKTTQ
ncbi:MAG: group III truncated hemoglobin [Alphaproteobacteria bacterium]|nr:group III truncated hemoglobin [Alphaproteobacteria bacterium]